MSRIASFSLALFIAAGIACIVTVRSAFDTEEGQQLSSSRNRDWDAWHRKRVERLNEDLASISFGGGPPVVPKTGEEYIRSYESQETPHLAIEMLPISEYRKVTQHLLDKFPIVDLNERLSYEDRADLQRRHTRGHDYSLQHVVSKLQANWNTEYDSGTGMPLEYWERPLPPTEGWTRSRYQRALEILHRDRLEAFADQNSFGFARIPEIAMDDLHVYLSEPVYMPQPLPVVDQERKSFREPYENEKQWAKEVREHYAEYLHLSVYHQFGRDRAFAPAFRQARGFQPHAVRTSVGWSFDVYEEPTPPLWHVVSLELVSLLKHERPKVYISDHLPNMSLLASAATRELDSFEASSLPRLFAGEFLVADESSDQMRVLGAIHAGQTCTECHAVRPGQLLGAFSYELNRVTAEETKGDKLISVKSERAWVSEEARN